MDGVFQGDTTGPGDPADFARTDGFRRWTGLQGFTHGGVLAVGGNLHPRVAVLRLPVAFRLVGLRDEHGIDETMSIDACKHSLFGASKVAAGW